MVIIFNFEKIEVNDLMSLLDFVPTVIDRPKFKRNSRSCFFFECIGD